MICISLGPVEYATGVKRDGPFYTMGARLKDRNQSMFVVQEH